jgi:hypothetical protein
MSTQWVDPETSKEDGGWVINIFSHIIFWMTNLENAIIRLVTFFFLRKRKGSGAPLKIV